MADFWAGVAQGFGPAYQRSTDRRELIKDRKLARTQSLEDRKEAAIDAAITAYTQAGGTNTRTIASRDLEVLRIETANLVKATENKVHRRIQDKERRGMMQTLGKATPKVRREALMDYEGVPVAGLAPGVDARTLEDAAPEDYKKMDLGALGMASARSEAQQTIANELAREQRDEDRKKEAEVRKRAHDLKMKGTPQVQLPVDYAGKLKYEEDVSKIPTRPSGTDDAKGIAARAVANNHARNPDIKERFYEGINIETAHPAVLEDINKRIGEVDKLTKKMTDSYYTAQQVGEDIATFREQRAEIEKLQKEGKEVPEVLLNDNIRLGDTLTYLHSTRPILPEGVSVLMANAPKRPTSPVMAEVTGAHEIATLTESLVTGLNQLKTDLGEDRMKKAVGMIDDPLDKIRATLGVLSDSKDFKAIQAFKQKAQGISNQILKIRSGAAVTESEAERFLKEFADPNRENYFIALENAAANERAKARVALKTQQDAGFIFNKKLVDSIGAEVFTPTPEEPSKYQGLSSEEARQFDLLKKTDPAFMNPKMKELLELYKEKSGGK